MFLKISQISQENTCVGVFFVIKLQALRQNFFQALKKFSRQHEMVVCFPISLTNENCSNICTILDRRGVNIFLWQAILWVPISVLDYIINLCSSVKIFKHLCVLIIHLQCSNHTETSQLICFANHWMVFIWYEDSLQGGLSCQRRLG